MKKLFIFTMIVASTGYTAHGPAGCGLGSIMFQGKDGLIFNVVAGSFNSIGTQTLGMSTGTLGCEDATTAKVSAVSFIEGNNIALSNDISKGTGETLNTYLNIINKKKADREILRKSFSKIFAKGNTAKEINDKIISII